MENVKELEQDLYQPRMALLEQREMELKSNLVELCVSEEKIEVFQLLMQDWFYLFEGFGSFG
jgi:hypothetical protein